MNLENNNVFDDSEIIKQVNSLINFLYIEINKINDDITIRKNKIDFFDLFYYLVKYNSSTTCTHQQNLLNFNVDFNKNIEKNTFISRLEKLNPERIQQFNKSLINHYYSFYNIDKKNLFCSVDGSNIKFLASLSNYFKLNKNNLYTNGYLSCVFDIENKIPIYYDIFKSSNEITNFKSQIKEDTNNMTYITDRGYDDIQLINFYINNKMFFISRLVKNNNFTKQIIKNENIENEKIFNYDNQKNITQLKIVNYCNVKKPNIEESKETLFINKNDIYIKINEIDNKIKLIDNENNKIKKNIKEDKQNLKITIDKNKKKELSKNICVLRINKKKNKDNKGIFLIEIKNLQKKYNVIKTKIEELEKYEHSEYYILTNNTNLSLEKLKKIYKKRWIVETEFKYHKTMLNLNQMDNKNINIIKQNIYIIQFISIMNAFINKILEKYIKKDHHLNNNLILSTLHTKIMFIFQKMLINKKIFVCEKNKESLKPKDETIDKTIDKTIKTKNNNKTNNNNNNIMIILKIFYELLKNQILTKVIITTKQRIKKRQSTNKFNYRKEKEKEK